MNAENIRLEKLNEQSQGELLPGEIDGAAVSVVRLQGDERYLENVNEGEAVVIVALGGECIMGGKSFDGITVFAFSPGDKIDVASEGCSFMRLSWKLNEGESVDKTKLPYALRYADAVKYREDCKSEKTVSRMLLPEGIIPRLAMGSVQTTGPDRVEKHEHPFCDQLFYTLPECSMELLVDDISVHFDGDTLLHIPLASSHGVDVTERGCAHYIWVDFVIDPRGIEYLHSAHEKIE